MQILSLSLRGAIGVQRGLGLDEIYIDFTQFGPGLVVFVGSNGSSKSTIMDNLTPFLELMSKSGSLYDHFYLPDSHRILFARMYGALYEFKLLINPITRDTEAYVIRDGVPVNKSGGPKTYIPEIVKLFGSKELFKRSVFRAQNATSFASLTAGDRKKLFVELLGIDKIAAYHEIAKRKFTEAERDVEKLRAKVQAIIDTAGDPEAYAQVVESARSEVARNTDALNRARADLAEAEAALKSAQEAQQAIEIIRQTAQEARQRATAAKDAYEEAEAEFATLAFEYTSRKAALDTRRSTAQKYIDGRPKITEALETMERLKSQSAEMDKLAQEGFRLKSELDAVNLRAQRDISALKDECMRASEEAARALRHRDEAVSQRNSDIRLISEKIAELEKRTALLSTVPCAGTEMNNTCDLLKSARADLANLDYQRSNLAAIEAKTFEDYDADVESTAKHLAETKDAIDTATDHWNAEIAAAQLDYDAIQYDPIAHREIVDQLAAMEKQDWPRHKANADAAEEQIAQIDADMAVLEEQRVRQRDASQERCRKAKAEAERLDADATAKEFNAMNTESVDIQWQTGECQMIRNNAEMKERELAESQRQLTAAETRLAAANEALAKASEYQTEQRAAEKHAERLAYIVKATGKNGIQALELAASGPNVSAIANQLLADTFGTEYQIAFDTTALSADGKKELDTFDIRVSRGIDGEQPVEYLSPGEQVWVDGAIFQSIAIYLRQQSELDLADSFLDEADGALNSENAFLYLQMIRAAQNMSGVHHTFMVTHRQELLALIPQQIRLSKERGLEIYN